MHRLLLLLRRRQADDRRETARRRNPGASALSGLTVTCGSAVGAAQPVIGREQALRTAAQQPADDRNIAEQRIQRVSRRDRALQLEPIVVQIDPAIGGDPERFAKRQQLIEREAASRYR